MNPLKMTAVGSKFVASLKSNYSPMTQIKLFSFFLTFYFSDLFKDVVNIHYLDNMWNWE